MSSKNVFLFAGQGAQFIGMGKDLYEEFDIAKEYFDKADNIIPGLKNICFEGPEEELKKTKYQQPGVFTVSAVLDTIIKEKGMKPEVTAGFSLGEYAALFSAGVFEFDTGIELVKVRGEAMMEACEQSTGTMAAIIGLDDDVVEALREVNLQRVEDLINIPRLQLAARFGPDLLLRLDQATGQARQLVHARGERTARADARGWPGRSRLP